MLHPLRLFFALMFMNLWSQPVIAAGDVIMICKTPKYFGDTILFKLKRGIFTDSYFFKEDGLWTEIRSRGKCMSVKNADASVTVFFNNCEDKDDGDVLNGKWIIDFDSLTFDTSDYTRIDAEGANQHWANMYRIGYTCSKTN